MGCYYLTMALPGRKGEGMVFKDANEVQLAHSLGKVDTHATIKLKLPPNRRLKIEGELLGEPGARIETTVGRVLFNSVLPEGMLFYNIPMRSSELARVISDCYQALGRHEPYWFQLEHQERTFFCNR